MKLIAPLFVVISLLLFWNSYVVGAVIAIALAFTAALIYLHRHWTVIELHNINYLDSVECGACDGWGALKIVYEKGESRLVKLQRSDYVRLRWSTGTNLHTCRNCNGFGFLLGLSGPGHTEPQG